MNFFRNVTGLLFTAVVRTPIALLSSIVLARYLSTDDRGLYAVALSFGTVLTLLSQVGWPSAAIYRLRRIQSPAGLVMSAGLVAMTAMSALVVAICIALEPFISERFLDGAPPQVFYVAIAIVPLHLLSGFLRALARGLDRFALQNWASFLGNALTLAGFFIVLVLRDGALMDALLTVLAIQIGLTLWLALVVIRHTGLQFGGELTEIRESLRYGAKAYLQGLAGRLHERVDVFMLAYLLADPTQVALYAIATGLVSRLKIVPNSMAKAAFPQMSGLEQVDAIPFTARVCRQSAFWAIATAVGLAVIAPLLIPLLYGEDYLGSTSAFMILVPGMTFMTLYRVLSRYFSSIDRQQINIATQALSAAVNIGLNFVLIPRYGIIGAASASLLSYALESTLITIAFLRATGLGLGDVLVPTRSDFEAYRRRLAPILRRLHLA